MVATRSCRDLRRVLASKRLGADAKTLAVDGASGQNEYVFQCGRTAANKLWVEGTLMKVVSCPQPRTHEASAL